MVITVQETKDATCKLCRIGVFHFLTNSKVWVSDTCDTLTDEKTQCGTSMTPTRHPLLFLIAPLVVFPKHARQSVICVPDNTKTRHCTLAQFRKEGTTLHHNLCFCGTSSVTVSIVSNHGQDDKTTQESFRVTAEVWIRQIQRIAAIPLHSKTLQLRFFTSRVFNTTRRHNFTTPTSCALNGTGRHDATSPSSPIFDQQFDASARFA